MKLSNFWENFSTIWDYWTENDYDKILLYENMTDILPERFNEILSLVLTAFLNDSNFRNIFDGYKKGKADEIVRFCDSENNINLLSISMYHELSNNIHHGILWGKSKEETEIIQWIDIENDEEDYDDEEDWNLKNIKEYIVLKFGPENVYTSSADWGGIPVWGLENSNLYEGHFIGIDDNDDVFFMTRIFDEDLEENIEETILTASSWDELGELFHTIDLWIESSQKNNVINTEIIEVKNNNVSILTDIVKYVESISYFDADVIIDELDSTDTEIMFNTRENGSIYDELPGSADINEAKSLREKIKLKFPDINLKTYYDITDEWVNLYVEIKN